MLFISCVCYAFARLFIVALWSPAGKGLTSWLLFVIFNCVFVTFPCGILGQVWYLIVLILDICRLSYFKPRPRRLRHLKPEPMTVEFSGAPGHKTTKNINASGSVLIATKSCNMRLRLLIYYIRKYTEQQLL